MRFVPISVLSLLLLCPLVSADVPDVLVHASADRAWVGRVTTQSTVSGTLEQTDLLIRQSGPGERWKTLATIPARVTALACRNSQLAILQSNGDWKLIWSAEGGSSGQPLPGNGRIRALGDDSENLWAVGAVNGGLSAATEPATTEPNAVPAPASQPVKPYKLVLFEQRSGHWTGLADFPAEPDTLAAVSGDISLALVAGRPLVAFATTGGSIRTLRFTTEKTWEVVGQIAPPPGQRIAVFQLIDTGSGPLLWTTTGKNPGRIYPGADNKTPPVDLKWVGGNGPDSLPAIAAAGGYLRLVALHGEGIFEQRYKFDGTPVDSAAELVIPGNLNDPVKQWLNVALIVALAFSVMATLYRRTLLRKRLTELSPPPPAPLLPRVAAGFIDVLPVLATAAWVTAHQDKSRDPLDRLQDVPALIAVGVSIAVYLLHTSLAEAFTARSIGKWLFGLKVISIDGSAPTVTQLLIRNVLRVLDLGVPPLLILAAISPLRQRSADIAAGTMVVKASENQSPDVDKQPPDEGNISNS